MTATNIIVREANPGDTDVLVQFQQCMAQETEGISLDLDILREGVNAIFLSVDKGFFLVAEVNGQVAASLLITYEWSDWRNATFWWIQSVYVDVQLRRKGVFKAMYNYVYDLAVSRDDICGIRLYVDRNNLVAQQIYDSIGMSSSHYYMYEIDFVL